MLIPQPYKTLAAVAVVLSVLAGASYMGYSYRDKSVRSEIEAAKAEQRNSFDEQIARSMEKQFALEVELTTQDAYLNSVSAELEKALKKPAKHIVKTNEVIKYETCDMDSMRLDIDVIRLLNLLREGKPQ